MRFDGSYDSGEIDGEAFRRRVSVDAETKDSGFWRTLTAPSLGQILPVMNRLKHAILHPSIQVLSASE